MPLCSPVGVDKGRIAILRPPFHSQEAWTVSLPSRVRHRIDGPSLSTTSPLPYTPA